MQEHLTRAEQLRQDSARAQAAAAAELRSAVRELVAAGLPLRDVGHLLGVSTSEPISSLDDAPRPRPPATTPKRLSRHC